MSAPRMGLRGRLALGFSLAVGLSILLFSGVVIVALQVGNPEDFRGLKDDPHLAEIEKADTTADRHQVLVAMALALPLSAAAAALLGRWLANRAVAPMLEASARAEEARTSTLDLKLPVTGSDSDWDGLALTLNRLLVEGRGAMVRIQRFTGDAAHELRTPIYAILGEIEVTLRRERSPEELRRSLEIVFEDATRLSRIVESLLLLARADERNLVSPTAAQRRVALAVQALAAKVAARGFRARGAETEAPLKVTLGGEAVMVLVDEVLFDRVFANLLGNSARYGAKNVTVTAGRESNGAVVIDLMDDGPGIPPDMAPRIFERFARGGRTPSGFGQGLGLAISKAIVEAHEGTLTWVPSPNGAHFRIVLPPSAVAPA